MMICKRVAFSVVFLLMSLPLFGQIIRPKSDNGDPVCTAVPVGYPPEGYYAGTRKCLSSDGATCSDSVGVEAVFDQKLTVMSVGNQWPAWKNSFDSGSAESTNPAVYGQSIKTSNTINLALKHMQGLLGLEVDNLTYQVYLVTFHTTVGDVSAGKTVVGGTVPPDPFAQRFMAICSEPAITGVTVQCTNCTETAGDGTAAISQIRGDKFKGGSR